MKTQLQCDGKLLELLVSIQLISPASEELVVGALTQEEYNVSIQLISPASEDTYTLEVFMLYLVSSFHSTNFSSK